MLDYCVMLSAVFVWTCAVLPNHSSLCGPVTSVDDCVFVHSMFAGRCTGIWMKFGTV